MYNIILIVFFLCVLAVVHTYVLYPLFLFVFSDINKRREQVYLPSELPVITVIIAAYNEEKVIAAKIKSILESGYPLEKIRILIGSDASTDSTNNIVRKFSDSNEHIKLFVFSGRTGKINIVNKLVSESDTEFLVLTDANVFFKKDTLYHLIKHFKDPLVGQVCANILKISDSKTGVSKQEQDYLDFENSIKLRESSKWDFVIGAEGGCNAVRRSNFNFVPSNFCVDDFYTTMDIISQAKKIIFESEALCIEDVGSSSEVEFKRKVRISTGNFQNLFRFKKLLLNPFSAISFSFISHKVLRWLTPFLILIAFLCSLYLSFYDNFFLLLTALQLFGLLSPLFKINIFPFKMLSHFYLMNIALLKGFFVFMQGVESSIWEPTRRNV
jgi:cellulose synthase/poly-beta-1,6-N-acetylglucosamine synthase-like glycosyltransferase